MEKLIDSALNDYFANGHKTPKLIVVNKKDYKIWVGSLRWGAIPCMEFYKKLKDHNLSYRGIKIICSKQVSKGEVLVA